MMDEDDPRWAAVCARDATADGQFVYSVATTGVYCRPGCGARQPNRHNVRFHQTPAEAAAAGFRPCRRCRPDADGPAHAEAIAAACRTIEAAEDMPLLADLAAAAALSAAHFHKAFKAVTGLTPRGYAAAHRAARVRAALAGAARVVDAAYDAGFGSAARFYAAAPAMLGMAPARFRRGAQDVPIRFAIGACALGAILVAESDRGVCAILLGDDPEALVQEVQGLFAGAVLTGDDPAFAERVATVIGLVEAPRLGHDLPLDIRGTAFQQRVWQALASIPPGTTATYAEVAAAIGAPTAVRAVAGACAANRLAVAIPCHRVVRTDGGLSGYRWGVERKRALLGREAG